MSFLSGALRDLVFAMEPSPKRTKTDMRTLSNEDLNSIRKMTLAFEKTLRLKNQQNMEIEEELKAVKSSCEARSFIPNLC
jgi:hypothetical protein